MAMSRFAVDYWTPCPALAGLVSGYHRYTLSLAPGERHHDVFFPAWANIRFKLPGEPWQVRLAGTTHDIRPGGVVFGATSHAGFSDSGSGGVIGAGLTPLGWTRLTNRPACALADTITPLAALFGPAAARLAAEVAAADDPAAVLDAFFLARLRPRRVDEDRIVAMHAALAQGTGETVAQVATRLGISPRRFNDISRTVFGFGPKLLLRRARFLESLLELDRPSALADSARISAGYHDHSHFIHDAQLFLGMTPRAFLTMRRPINAASMRKRAEVLGAPAQALSRPRAAA